MGTITSWDSMVKKFILKFHHLSDHSDDEEMEEEDPNETNIAPEIFMIEGNLFDFETPLDHEARNVSCNQEDQGHKDNLIPEPSKCKVRRFEMMKYSFDDDEEYITIKESEYLKHSKDSLDAYQELLRLIDGGWVVTTPSEA
ncbi:hypothetical protein Tco_1240179 [Tanacetum coccineum]